MRQWPVLLYTCLLIGLLVVSCKNDGVDAEAVVRDYESAHNSADRARLLESVADDVVFEADGNQTGFGKQRLNALFAWDSTLNSSLTFDIQRVSNDSVYCIIVEKNDWYKGLGFKQVVHENSVFVVQEEKITRIISNPPEELRRELSQALGALKRWSDANEDPTLDKLIADGDFVFSPEAANMWVELLDRWRTAIGLGPVQ